MRRPSSSSSSSSILPRLIGSALLLGLLALCGALPVRVAAWSFHPTAAVSPGSGLPYNVTYHDQGESTTYPVVRIGVMYSGTGPFSVFGAHTRRLAVSWLNDLLAPGNGTIDGGNGVVAVSLILCDVASVTASALSCANKLLTYGISTAIAPESTLAVDVQPLFEARHIPVVAPLATQSFIFICDQSNLAPCTRPSSRRFKYLFGTQPLASDLLRDYVNLLKVQGAKTVALIKNSDSFSSEVCDTADTGAVTAGLNVVYRHTLVPADDYAARRAIVATVKELDPDAVFFIDRTNCTGAMNLFGLNQYAPRSLMTIQCVDYPTRMLSDPYDRDHGTYGTGTMRYVLGATGWDPRLRGQDYQEDATLGYCDHFVPRPGSSSATSPLVFQEYFLALSGGVTPTYSHSGIMMAYYLMEAAIAASGSNLPTQLYNALSSVYLPSFNGRLSIDSYGLVRSSPIVLYQVSATGSLEIISPVSSQTKGQVYPVPSYDERFFVNRLFEDRLEKVAIALVVVAQAYLLTLLIAMIGARHHARIRAMSWKFSAATIVSAMILVVSILTWTINNTEAQCQARVPLIFIGYSTFLCSIFARVFRLHRIFNEQRMQVVSYPDGKLALIALIPLVPMWIVFLVGVGVFPMHVQEQSPNANDPATLIRPSLNYTDCTIGGDGAVAILYTLLSGSLFLTAIIYYLARRTKHVPALYNSPMEIVNSLGLFLICFCVALVLVLTGATQSNRSADFGVRSIFVFVACCGSIHGLYFDTIRRASLEVYFGYQSEPLGVANATMYDQNHTETPPTLPLSSVPLPARGTQLKINTSGNTARVHPKPSLTTTSGTPVGGGAQRTISSQNGVPAALYKLPQTPSEPNTPNTPH